MWFAFRDAAQALDPVTVWCRVTKMIGCIQAGCVRQERATSRQQHEASWPRDRLLIAKEQDRVHAGQEPHSVERRFLAIG